MNINGLIGYTYLIKKNIKLILIADMHSVEYECSNVYISDWLKTKLKSNWKLLLEEVPRTPENQFKLKELFPSAIHTSKLKKLYLEDSINIIGIDIRGDLLNFSLELIDEIKPNETLQEYLSLLDDFFNLKHKSFLTNLQNFYKKEILTNLQNFYKKEILTNLQNFYKKEILTNQSYKKDIFTENIIALHFETIYKNYEDFLLKYKHLYKTNIRSVHLDNPSFIDELNVICSNIMEWYTIIKIFEEWHLGTKHFIIHCGLFHSSNIKQLLLNLYEFTQIDDQGLTDLKRIELMNHTGCLVIPKHITKLI